MELSLGWPSTAMSMESLRPLSPDNFADDQINRDVVDKLSRSELAGKLLDHFDGIQEEGNVYRAWSLYLRRNVLYSSFFCSLPRLSEGKYPSDIFTHDGLCSSLKNRVSFFLEWLFPCLLIIFEIKLFIRGFNKF